MFKERPLYIIVICVVTILVTVTLQIFNPTFTFLHGGYVAAILLTVFLKEVKYTMFFGFLSIGLIICTAFLPGRISNNSELIMREVFSLVMASFTFLAVLFVKRLYVDVAADKRLLIEQKEQLEIASADVRKLNAELENKVEERTLILKEALNELEKSQQVLNEALYKERELNEIKSRFVSTASHEFRTPLSTVLSSASLLAKYEKTEDQDKRERHIRRIKESVRHLNDLLEDFLSLGKLQEGKIFAKPEAFDLKIFLNEVADGMKPLAKPGHRIIVDWDNSLIFHTDKKLLKNILTNLLSNAIKFSPEVGTVWVQAHYDSHQLIITVQDQGIGISEEDQQHLFTSFYRGKNAVNIQGTGLGLLIVREYVELLHGAVRVASQLNEGTRITLILPDLKHKMA